MPDLNDSRSAVAWLRTPQAIRQRCQMVFDAAERGELAHFALDPGRLDAAADYVVETIQQNYPALDIPCNLNW